MIDLLNKDLENLLMDKNVLSEYLDNKLVCKKENMQDIVRLILKALNSSSDIALDVKDIMKWMSKNVCNAVYYCGSKDDILDSINTSELEEVESEPLIMYMNGEVSLADSSEIVSAVPQTKNIIFSCSYEEINTIEVLLLY